jgi:LysR family nitrogen assimilation transcriptional regulator
LPLDDVPLLLPGAANALRQLIDAVFSRLRLQPRLVAEIESFQTLSHAVARGLGATILPLPVAASLAEQGGLAMRPFGGRTTRVALSLCTPAEEIASEAGRVIFQLANDLADAIALRPGAPRATPPTPGAPAPAR